MNTVMQKVEERGLSKDLPEFRVGDSVRVHVKVVEGEKERIQSFEGIVIKMNRGANRAAFTVRKISYGVGVERIFPLHSPRIDRLQVLSKSKVRRARLYYLRGLFGKSAPPRYHRLSSSRGAARGHLDVAAEVRAFTNGKIIRRDVAVNARVR